jgi:hypothetical protein
MARPLPDNPKLNLVRVNEVAFAHKQFLHVHFMSFPPSHGQTNAAEKAAPRTKIEGSMLCCIVPNQPHCAVWVVKAGTEAAS